MPTLPPDEVISEWTHSICERCWTERHPERWPVRARHPEDIALLCCYCGKPTWVGIFLRAEAAPFCRHDQCLRPFPRPKENDGSVKV